MNPQKKEPSIEAFGSARAWQSWLSKNHARSGGLRLKIFKKDSAVPSIPHAEALEIPLCYG